MALMHRLGICTLVLIAFIALYTLFVSAGVLSASEKKEHDGRRGGSVQGAEGTKPATKSLTKQDCLDLWRKYTDCIKKEASAPAVCMETWEVIYSNWASCESVITAEKQRAASTT